MKQALYTDSEIIEGLKNNDERIALYFQKTYFQYARAALYDQRKSLRLANDLFNDAYIALMQNIMREGFRLEFALSTYMYTIFIRLARKIESAHRQNEHFDEVLNSPEEEPPYDRVHDSKVFRDIIDKNLNQLKEKCKEILKRVWKKMAYESIAGELGITVKYVNKKKTLCRKELMRNLMNDPDYEIIVALFPGITPDPASERKINDIPVNRDEPYSGSNPEPNSESDKDTDLKSDTKPNSEKP